MTPNTEQLLSKTESRKPKAKSVISFSPQRVGGTYA